MIHHGALTPHAQSFGDVEPCDGPCGRVYSLLMRCRDGRSFCPPCWEGAGRPEQRALMSQEDLEHETRKQMQKRGGEDRHRVRAGKS